MPIPLHFRCVFTSPFHTSNRMYGNLYTCAPWVMGSTLRGAILTQMLRRYCPAERIDALNERVNPGEKAAYHAACDADCPVRGMFAEEETAGGVRFSFGQIRGKMTERTKVGIARDTWSVAGGALLTYQIYPAKSELEFWVRVPDGVEPDRVVEAVQVAGGEYGGIGRFRNQGFGRFKVREMDEAPPPGPTVVDGNAGGCSVECEFTAPYVLPTTRDSEKPNLLRPAAFGAQPLREDLDRLFEGEWCAIYGVTVGEEGVVEYDYLSRWCYEDGERHHRAVVLPGGRFALRFADGKPEAADLQELAWGIGEWAYMGFGAVGPMEGSGGG